MDILERHAALAALAAQRDSALGSAGRFVIVSGGPGIGKSTLLRAFADECRAGGIATQVASGGEFEDDIGFGVLRELFAGLAAHHPDVVGQSPGARAVFVDAPPDGDAIDPGEILGGVQRLLVAATGTAPAVLVVDDIQWADPATVRYLSYLARRVGPLRCLVVLGLRAGPRRRLRADVAALVQDAPGPRVDLPGLTPAGVAAIIGRLIGAELAPAFAAECSSATGGNPLLCVLLARELQQRGVRGGADELGELRAVGGGEVAESVNRRLSRCPPAATELARAVAVLGQYATLARASRLAGLPLDSAVALVDALANEELVLDANPIVFTHPILRSAATGTMSAGTLARWHGAAGRLLVAEGLDEPAAHHLHLAEPRGDAEVVELLRSAAKIAIGRGAPQEAAAYLERALAEPPPRAQQALIGYELGRAASHAGLPSAGPRLQAALEATRDPDLIAQIALVLGGTQIWAGRWDDSLCALEAALALTDDPPTRDRLILQIVLAATGSARARRASNGRIRALRAAPGPLPIALRAVLAIELAMTDGPADQVLQLATAALGTDELLAGDAAFSGLYEMTAAVLGMAGGPGAAITALDTAVAFARNSGNALTYSRANVLRGFTLQKWGRPRAAELDLRIALGIDNSEIFNATQRPAAVGLLVDALLDVEGPLAARAAAGQYGITQSRDPDNAASQHLAIALARLAIAERQPEAALAALVSCRAWERDFGGRSVAFAPWRPLAIAANLMLERQPEAARLSAELSELAEAFGSPAVRATALRAHALVHGELEAMQRCIDLFGVADTPARQAEALIELGVMLRARRRLPAARETMRLAVAAATRVGADALAEQATAELRSSGGRPRRPHSEGAAAALTAAELRTSRLAVDGLSNREIARACFLSPRTVEMHLSNAYRKLGIRSRDQLAGALDDAAISRSWR